MKYCCFSLCVCLALTTTALAQNKREVAVFNDKEKLQADDTWIYNDLERGIAQARAAGKPLLVLVRCIP